MNLIRIHINPYSFIYLSHILIFLYDKQIQKLTNRFSVPIHEFHSKTGHFNEVRCNNPCFNHE